MERMERINRIIHNQAYRECVAQNKAAERERIFCRHDMGHFMDVARIGQIINKLLHMLLSYMEQGQIAIEVSARSVQYATMMMIQIKDVNGVIPEEKIERMRRL